MRKTLTIAALLSIMGSAAIAAEGKAPKCSPLDKFKADIAEQFEGIKFTALSVGQFHVAQGIYLGLPNTPSGLPPADGAIFGKVAGRSDRALIWTRGGKQACGVIVLPGGLAAILDAIHTGKLEEPPIDPSSKPDPSDLKL